MNMASLDIAIAWSETYPIDYSECESLGFVPRNFGDQIPSLFTSVSGLLVNHAADGNTRNLDAVVAVVGEKSFHRSRQAGYAWDWRTFKVGSKDCVAFTNQIAGKVGLATPDCHNKYPQDYIRELKSINKGSFYNQPRLH